MVQVSYPGVYIQEKSSGVRTITGVATSIAAFVDAFPRGVLDEAVQCLSFADFEREFGGIHTSSPASYGVKQFFQNGGSECVGGARGTLSAGTRPRRRSGRHAGRRRRHDVSRPAGRQIRGEIAVNPGGWGNNVLLDVDDDRTDPETVVQPGRHAKSAVNNGRRSVLRTETFRNLTMRPGAPNNALGRRQRRLAPDTARSRRHGGAARVPAVPAACRHGHDGRPVDRHSAQARSTSRWMRRRAMHFAVTYTGTLRRRRLAAADRDRGSRCAAQRRPPRPERSAHCAGATVRLIGRGTGSLAVPAADPGRLAAARRYDPAATLTMTAAPVLPAWRRRAPKSSNRTRRRRGTARWSS